MIGRSFIACAVIGAFVSLLAPATVARASEADAPAETVEQAEQEPAEPTPPPGMVIVPSAPPRAEQGVPGCPVRNTKPLELLV